VIEKLYAGSLESHLAELAHHFFEAAYTGCADKAVEYAVRAAERAVTQLAYEEAVNHYEQALQALELLEPADAALNCEVLLGLGDAHKKAGHSEEAREVYVRAAGQARQMKSPAHLARATLGTATSLTGIIGRVDETQVNLLEEALSALPQTDSPLRAMVLAHLALAHYYSPDLREPLSREAVEMARRVADPRAEMAALYSRHAALSATVNVEERLKIATELLALAERIDDKERMLRGHYLRMLDQLEIGDMPAVNKEIEAYDSLSKELRQPLYLWQTPFFRASLALLEGRFQECEQLAQEGLAKAQRTVDPTTGMFFDVVMTALRLVQGREEDREDAIKRFMKRYTKIPGERAVLANLYCRLGRFEEAGREFEQVTADNFGGLPRDGSWVVTMANLCFVCSYLRDTARAATLYGLLLPYANRQVVTGRSAVAAGSVSRFLGILATTMQQWDKAVKHFEDALEMNERLEARPFIALTQKEYGAMLLTRGAERDREKAVHLLDRALATGLELGMLGLIRDVQTLKATL
jgi:tetratricopeptide (TPR) repeat protein